MNTQEIIQEANRVLAEANKKLSAKKDESLKEDLVRELISTLKSAKDEELRNEITEQITEAIKQAIKEIKIEIPKIDSPRVMIPPIKIPQAIVNVSSPEVNVPEIKMPKEMKITGMLGFAKDLFSILRGGLEVVLRGVDKNSPLPVILVDTEGNYLAPQTTTQVTQVMNRRITMYVGKSIGTGDGITKTFTLPTIPYDASQVVMYVGITSYPTNSSDFSISGDQVTFSTAPPDGANVAVTMQG